MTITGTKGTRALSKNYPVTTGLTAETTKQEGRNSYLQPSGFNGKKTNIYKKDRLGI
jgi:hypothetical protein